MTEEQVLINHIQEYLDSGMWQYEACYLNRSDLKVIIKALEKEFVLDKIRAEIIERDRNVKAIRSDGCCFFTTDEILNIIDKCKAEIEDKI